MSELGKVEERRSTDMGVYHLLCKAGNGLRPDILPWETTGMHAWGDQKLDR